MNFYGYRIKTYNEGMSFYHRGVEHVIDGKTVFMNDEMREIHMSSNQYEQLKGTIKKWAL